MSPSHSGKARAWKAHLRELLRHGDFRTLVLLAVVVGSLWGFIELADEVREGGLREIDLRLLYLLRDPANPASPLGMSCRPRCCLLPSASRAAMHSCPPPFTSPSPRCSRM